jgi:Dullard-like phosphatase family protein
MAASTDPSAPDALAGVIHQVQRPPVGVSVPHSHGISASGSAVEEASRPAKSGGTLRDGNRLSVAESSARSSPGWCAWMTAACCSCQSSDADTGAIARRSAAGEAREDGAARVRPAAASGGDYELPMSDSKAVTPDPSSDSAAPGETRMLVKFSPIRVPPKARHAINWRRPLLPSATVSNAKKMCLVLDLDETLVHSSFKPVSGADLVVPVRLNGSVHPVHVMLRPGCHGFLNRLSRLFEIVVFTASVDYYANPLLDRLDPDGQIIHHRLFRESCVLWQGNYIKDMSLLGRDERRTILVDNSPASYLLQPQNALPCSSFFDDKTDTELVRLERFLTFLARQNGEDVRTKLYQWSEFADGGLAEDDTDVIEDIALN